jgi:hypothetical protein
MLTEISKAELGSPYFINWLGFAEGGVSLLKQGSKIVIFNVFVAV